MNRNRLYVTKVYVCAGYVVNESLTTMKLALDINKYK